MPKALVTGSAGFIGFHLCQRLLADGYEVIGLDAMTDYYDVTLKQRRQAMLLQAPGFRAVTDRIERDGVLQELIAAERPDVIVHLAAQAGVRYSIDNPQSYVEANLIGTFKLLEAVRATPCAHLLMASTSSVYGANTEMPYAEGHKADTQMSFYAATKKANEAMGHSYAHLYDLPITMFRFFTVYGPWGRPDMALFKFTKAILNGEAIDVYNHGDMRRDFTYIDDLVQGIRLLIDAVPERPGDGVVADGDSLSPVAPFRVVNIGNSEPVQLLAFIEAIEAAIGQKARRNYMEMQPGDVPRHLGRRLAVADPDRAPPADRRDSRRRGFCGLVSGLLRGVTRSPPRPGPDPGPLGSGRAVPERGPGRVVCGKDAAQTVTRRGEAATVFQQTGEHLRAPGLTRGLLVPGARSRSGVRDARVSGRAVRGLHGRRASWLRPPLRGRSGRRSLPWSRPRRSHARISRRGRPGHTVRNRPAGSSLTRRPDRAGWRSISLRRSCGR